MSARLKVSCFAVLNPDDRESSRHCGNRRRQSEVQDSAHLYQALVAVFRPQSLQVSERKWFFVKFVIESWGWGNFLETYQQWRGCPPSSATERSPSLLCF
jgi:hypothetical protein